MSEHLRFISLFISVFMAHTFSFHLIFSFVCLPFANIKCFVSLSDIVKWFDASTSVVGGGGPVLVLYSNKFYVTTTKANGIPNSKK